MFWVLLTVFKVWDRFLLSFACGHAGHPGRAQYRVYWAFAFMFFLLQHRGHQGRRNPERNSQSPAFTMSSSRLLGGNP